MKLWGPERVVGECEARRGRGVGASRGQGWGHAGAARMGAGEGSIIWLK